MVSGLEQRAHLACIFSHQRNQAVDTILVILIEQLHDLSDFSNGQNVQIVHGTPFVLLCTAQNAKGIILVTGDALI